MGRGVSVQVSNQAPEGRSAVAIAIHSNKYGLHRMVHQPANVAINPSQRAKTLPAAGTELIHLRPPTTPITRMQAISCSFQPIYIP